jgi:hypothetical protein
VRLFVFRRPLVRWAVTAAATVASALALDATATATARHRSWSAGGARTASAAGYVVLEVAKEIPYYAGAFGSALLSTELGAAEAIGGWEG